MGETRDTYRAFTYEIAERIAPTWERRRADIEQVSTPVREWMIEALAPRPGETVLELAAGVGDTGFEAAALIGEDGHLICSDFSPAMLAAARRRGSELGLTNVDYRIIDAEHIRLDTDSVDGVLCRFGYMLLADPSAALAETRRVLRPDGRATLAVWGAPERNPFFTAAMMVLVEGGHLTPPEPGGPGPFVLADPERLRTLLQDTGFRHVRTEQVTGCFALPDIDEYVQTIADTAGPIGLAVQALSDADRRTLTAQCEAALERFKSNRGYEIPCVAVCAAAAK
ncbi:MAG: class I SAM-dependent methyltransferase [Thermoleophilaceae bacterium]